MKSITLLGLVVVGQILTVNAYSCDIPCAMNTCGWTKEEYTSGKFEPSKVQCAQEKCDCHYLSAQPGLTCDIQCAQETCGWTEQEYYSGKFDPSKVRCAQESCGCHALNAPKPKLQKASCDVPCAMNTCGWTKEEYYSGNFEPEKVKCAQEKCDCHYLAQQAPEKKSPVDNFSCHEELSMEECADLYAVAMFNGKLSEEELLQKVSVTNQENIKYFLKILNAKKTQIEHHEGHKESPSANGKQWDFSFSQDSDAVEHLLQKSMEMQSQYAGFKKSTAISVMKKIYQKEAEVPAFLANY